MRFSKREIVVVGAVGVVENGEGVPFSTNPQPVIRDRFEPKGRQAVAGWNMIEKERAAFSLLKSGAERK